MVFRSSTVAVALACLMVLVVVETRADTPKSEVVNGDAIRVPSNYRAAYQYLGSWSIAAPKIPGAKQLHTVYASPGAIDAFQKNGHFPDGAVLVKEVFAAATSTMSTGTVSRAATLTGWFVMVKDGKNTHSTSKLWGDGWGWSWFDAADPTKTASTDYKTDCLTCHEPAKNTDWIYTNGYPVLKH